MFSNCCTCSGPAISSIPMLNTPQLCSIQLICTKNCFSTGTAASVKLFRIKASMVESSHDSSAKRMERAWLISKQPRPVSCSSCESNGHVDCKWCGGTGFFIIGDNMLCQVPSRNTSCVICAGKGSTRCSDCKGTGFRAKWLEEPPVHK